MEGLISAARIGRSLGVHLVLATQKPAGVVSDQISANSRFRVCLRVADAADSKEMVRRADAARLEGPGRLLLLVGYDERYVLGQAAYAGGPYAPGASLRTKASVELLTPTGACSTACGWRGHPRLRTQASSTPVSPRSYASPQAPHAAGSGSTPWRPIPP